MKEGQLKQIVILGSTGSIGTQALEVVREHGERFEIYALTANRNADLLIRQAKEFQPDAVVIADETKYEYVKEALSKEPIKVYAGADAIAQIVACEPVDMVLTAMVGYAGLRPTIEAIKAGKAIALANKETLVVAGELITQLSLEHRTSILPVDSEHSAIFQCLLGEVSPVEKIILTASGGPFRNKTVEELKRVTKVEALSHPIWNMGAKITIDSATMMNKGFEVIEGKWLFGMNADQIDVVIHPQSIIHSMVQFGDGAIKAQMGVPDMKLPIRLAFSFPYRLDTPTTPRLDFSTCSTLTFEQPDMDRFPNLRFAYEALLQGGNIPCALNAANEVMVDAFLKDRISFVGIAQAIEETLTRVTFVGKPGYDDYVACDAEVRRLAAEVIGGRRW